MKSGPGDNMCPWDRYHATSCAASAQRADLGNSPRPHRCWCWLAGLSLSNPRAPKIVPRLRTSHVGSPKLVGVLWVSTLSFPKKGTNSNEPHPKRGLAKRVVFSFTWHRWPTARLVKEGTGPARGDSRRRPQQCALLGGNVKQACGSD